MDNQESDEDMPSSKPRTSSKSSESSDISLSIGGSAEVGSYNEAFDQAGFGLWQYFLLMQCGWANASDAVEIMSVSLIIPSLRDSMHVSHAELSLVTIVLFIGMMIGGYLWGSLADTYGRKKVVSFSLSVNAVFGALSALCRSYWLLLLLRLISGIGVGGSLPVVFSYFSEFQPVRYRGAMVSALATCWMAGNVIAAGMAWGVLPESHGLQVISPYGETWRLYVILCTVPCLSSAFFFWFMPESPKYLFKSGRMAEALQVLKTVHKWNNQTTNPTTFRIKTLLKEEMHVAEDDARTCINTETEALLDGTEIHKVRSRVGGQRSFFRSFVKHLWFNLKNFKSQLALVYGRQNNRLFTSTVLTFIYVFVAFGGYGMAMWTPVLMEKTEQFGGSPCRGHEGNSSVIPDSSNGSTTVYLDVFIGAASQLPGNAITVVLMDRVGAKAFTIFSSAASSLSVLGFWLVDTRLQVVAMNGFYSATSVMIWNSIDVITVEMYPTSIRSTATGHLNAVSRLGSIMGTSTFGLYMDLNCSVPIITVFIVFMLSALFSLKLPNTKNIVLQ